MTSIGSLAIWLIISVFLACKPMRTIRKRSVIPSEYPFSSYSFQYLQEHGEGNVAELQDPVCTACLSARVSES